MNWNEWNLDCLHVDHNSRHLTSLLFMLITIYCAQIVDRINDFHCGVEFINLQKQTIYITPAWRKQIDSLWQCRKVTIHPSMGRKESKAIVIPSGNILPFHIFLLPSKCYIVPNTRQRFRLLFQALSRLSDSVYRHVKHQLNKYMESLDSFLRYEWIVFVQCINNVKFSYRSKTNI